MFFRKGHFDVCNRSSRIEDLSNLLALSPPIEVRKYILRIVPVFLREHRRNIEAGIAYIKTTVDKQYFRIPESCTKGQW